MPSIFILFKLCINKQLEWKIVVLCGFGLGSINFVFLSVNPMRLPTGHSVIMIRHNALNTSAGVLCVEM